MARPREQLAPTGSVVDTLEPAIGALLREFPSMPVSVTAERVGREWGITVLRDRAASCAPLFLPPDPCPRMWYQPGELAQFERWQPDVAIPVGFGQGEKSRDSARKMSTYRS